MKRPLLISTVVLAACAAVFALGALEGVLRPLPELPSLLPEGALLSIEARDFSALLHDWNSSSEERAWVTSDNHAAFSNSRLFARLAQAQNEFSAAAGLPADSRLLENVAGEQSCLALYDIGNLEFVYITRLDQQHIENSPLWQTRGKFEQRMEAGSAFFVHPDSQSSRTAAFAVKDGWLILGTREDLVAGVLDRLNGTASHNLASEGWFAETAQQAASERGDLRMMLNLDKIVRTPYFRSYWIQQNITEMKQYTSAVSDLYRNTRSYREERVLLRRAGTSTASQADVSTLAAMVPENAAFYAAQASPSPESVLVDLRDNLLEARSQREVAALTTAPSAALAENLGSADQLDLRIDQAPLVAKQADAYAPLRALLAAQPLEASLEVFTSSNSLQPVFVSLQTAMALSSPQNWDESVVRQALTSALPRNLTAGNLGVNWKKRSSASGDYFALDGVVSLYLAVSGKRLLLSNDSPLLVSMLQRRQKAVPADEKYNVTYAALFQHTQEQGHFRRLMAQLDLAGNRGAADQQTSAGASQAPAFFSGNAASFSRVFSNLKSERIEERDQGTKVAQTVTYQWIR